METLTLASVTAIIPALDEEAAIGPIVAGLLDRGIGHVVVADGGSSDATASLARAAGAVVVVQPERGYGSACLAGVAAAAAAPVLLFLDGDGADDLDGAARVAGALLRGDADLVLGKRIVSLVKREPKRLRPAAATRFVVGGCAEPLTPRSPISPL